MKKNLGKLHKNSSPPDSISKLRPYLTKLWLPKQNERKVVYCKVFLGHYDHFDELRKAIHPWLSDHDHALYKELLQVEEASEVGWLEYSLRDIDTGALVDAIYEVLRIRVGL